MKRKPLLIISGVVLLSAGATAYFMPAYRVAINAPNSSQPTVSVVEDSQVTATVASAKVNTEADEVAPEDATLYTSKLAGYPGFGHRIEQEEEIFSEEELAREKFIAGCMQLNGFQYQPAPSVVIDEAAMSNPEEFERLLALSASDPNAAYVSSLSKDMQKSYYVTLVGMEDPNDPEGQAHDLARHSNSCTNQAFKKIPGVFSKRNVLSDEFDVMERRAAEDERVIKAQAQWSECMGDDGFAFTSPSDVHMHADQLMAEVFEGVARQDQKGNASEELERMIRSTERCVEASNLLDIKNRVRVEYENQFVKTHREQLDR